MDQPNPAQPDVKDINLTPPQMAKLLATLVKRLCEATGGTLLIDLDEVQNTEVGIDIKIANGRTFIVTAFDPNGQSKIVRADATVLSRLKNGSALTGIG